MNNACALRRILPRGEQMLLDAHPVLKLKTVWVKEHLCCVLLFSERENTEVVKETLTAGNHQVLPEFSLRLAEGYSYLSAFAIEITCLVASDFDEENTIVLNSAAKAEAALIECASGRRDHVEQVDDLFAFSYFHIIGFWFGLFGRTTANYGNCAVVVNYVFVNRNSIRRPLRRVMGENKVRQGFLRRS